MRLDESSWVLSKGLTAEWRWVNDRRREQALESFQKIVKEYGRRAPAAVRARDYASGLRAFQAARGAERDRLLTDPAFDYWLFLWDKHFSMPGDDMNWHLQFGLFQGFAAALALARGKDGAFDATLDSDAHLHFCGSPHRLEFPPELALKFVKLRLKGGAVDVEGPDGLKAKFPRSLFSQNEALRETSGKVSWVRAREIIPTISAESCGMLLVQGVVMHGLAHPGEKETADFAKSLNVALTHVAERDAGLYGEMTDLVRVLVPLVNPMKFGSVSSSYVNIRGMIALSHDWDPLLQAETLIHEFCHQKMNQLLLVDPILLPGQSGQVFYSPWRPDARRLRGLILGAHAFLNVAHYLARSLSREDYGLREKIAVMGNIARRLFEVDTATRSAIGYASFTEFGSRFILELARQTQAMFHEIQWFPPALIKEARVNHEKHRRQHCLPLTAIHRAKGFKASVRSIPFGEKRVIRRHRPEAEAA